MKSPTDTDNKRHEEHMDDVTMSPIGRLMDDGDEEDATPGGAYVSGFDRGRPAEPTPSAPTRPAPIPGTERERYSPRERERTAPSPSLSSDEDFFEVGVREARRERERRKPTNPNPRPAVRATVPTQRRMAAPPPTASPRTPPHEQTDDMGADEVYDTFRKRYNPDEIISSGRGGRAGRRPPGGDPRTSDARPEEDERINPARVAVAGGAFAFLLLLIILVVSMNNIRRERNYYRTAAQENANFVSRYNAARADVTELRDENNQLRTQRDNYRAQLDARPEPGTGAVPGGNAAPGTGDVAGIPYPDFPREHLVASGQNLTIIARIHYGAERVNRSPAIYTEHIRTYNNMPNENVFAGRTINIPAPPGQ